MHSRLKRTACRILALGLLVIGPYALRGQGTSKGMSYGDSPSRWDIFMGYSYLGPHGTVDVLQPDRVTVLPISYDAIDLGAIVSGSYYFDKYVGVQLESSQHHFSVNTDNDDFSFYQGGLVFRFPSDEVTPFIHGLVG
ncbi:MAG TPA: hypothetical protein VF742_09940, partial [Terracidiphilus sp.]